MIAPDVSCTTRMIVRRPASRGRANGAVVIEWWNSTAGFDTAPVSDASAEHFAREGITHVGVTNSTTSLGFLTGGSLFGVLPPTCSTRYSTLSLPENGLAFEMMSQIASLLKSDSDQNPLPAGFEAGRVYHAGQSQQGGSVIAYASSFHFPINDGYFVQQAATARPINFGPSCSAPGSPPFPGCTPRLQGSAALVRTDLPVPVYHAITETDIEVLFGTVGRQADTPTFRYYEVAGGSHLTVNEGLEILPAGVVGRSPILIEDLCANEINSTGDSPVFVSYVFNALWDNLEQQVRNERTPPASQMMELVNPVQVVRDQFGNGVGGVRLPSLEAPVATYTPGNFADPGLPPFLQEIGNLACRLASSVTPLDELYPNHGSYVSQVNHAKDALQQTALLLPKDGMKISARAAMSPFGCGLGFELALVLPGIALLRRRLGRSW